MIQSIAVLLFWHWLAAWIGVPPENNYRWGNRMYAAEKYAEAEQAYVRASRSPELRPWALYNAGNAAYHRQDFHRAVKYFEAALDQAPQDDDVWHNLELAQKRLAGLGAAAASGDASSPARALGGGSAARPKDQADEMLEDSRRAERKLSPYFVPPVARHSRALSADIFDLPPEELAEVLKEQTRAGYPFKPGSSLRPPPQPAEAMDW